MRRTIYLSLTSLIWLFVFQVKAQPVIYENKVFEGSDFQKIELTSANNGSRFINCTFKNITLSSGGVVMIEGADDVIFDGCTFENIKGSDYKDVHAIVCGTRGTNVVVRNSKFKSIAADGIQAGNKGEDIRNWQIYNNEFIDCRENGIDLKRVHGNFDIRNNYFAETKFCIKGSTLGCTGGGGSAITIHMGSKGVTIDGNRFYKNGNGITISVGPDPTEYGYPDNIVVSNNLIYESIEYGIRIRFAENSKIYNNTIVNSNFANFRVELESGQSVDTRNNLIVGADKYTEGIINKYGSSYGNLMFDDISKADFVDPSTYDLRLKDSSPAVDAGVFISTLDKDFEGDARVMGSASDVGGDEYTPNSTPSNVPPEVSIISPDNHSTLELGATLTVSAFASDADGNIVSVKFYNGSTLLAEDTDSPYSTDIIPEAVGEYNFTAVAEDDMGAITTSSPVNVMIVETDNNDPTDLPEETTSSHGLNYEYYEGQWRNLPDFSNITANKKGTTSNFELSERKRDDYFAFLFHGFIKIEESGTYTFYTSSDDGSKLYIDNKEVVNNDGRHALAEKSGQIYLSQGMHPIKVSFFEYKGKENLLVKYAGPGLTKQLIPDQVLFSEEFKEPENLAPEVTITNPEAYSTIELGTRFIVEALAVDEDGSVASVKFYDGSTLLAQDNTSPFSCEILADKITEYELIAVAEDDQGATSTSAAVKAVVVESDTPTEDAITFALMNAESDQPVKNFNPMEEGNIVDLSQVGTSLNVVLNIKGISDIARVRFDYNGDNHYQNERAAPYALGGDNNGDFSSWTPSLGANTITATVYSTAGDELAKETINFEVVSSANARLSSDDLQIKTYPNPALNELQIGAEDRSPASFSEQKLMEYKLIDISGNLVRSGTIEWGNQMTRVDVQGLQGGIYILQIASRKGLVSKKIFIEK